jgi:hypothetical protein
MFKFLNFKFIFIVKFINGFFFIYNYYRYVVSFFISLKLELSFKVSI